MNFDKTATERKAWMSQVEDLFGLPPEETWDIGMWRGELPARLVKKALDRGLLDKDDCYNSSPAAGDIIRFAVKWNLNVELYVINSDRSDARITVEGVNGYVVGITREQKDELKIEFEDLSSDADETMFNGIDIRAWWD